MNPETVLITGSNRGIGLQFVKDFLRLPVPPKVLIAACRNPENAAELQKLSTENKNLKLLKLDLLNQLDSASLAKVHSEVKELLGGNSLNLLINNAGVGNFDKFDLHVLTETYTVNSIGPLLLSKELMPLLQCAAQQITTDDLSLSRAGIVNISARAGSISDNGLGSAYAYRASKAALNMFTKNLSIDHGKDGILIVLLEPGPVATDMTADYRASGSTGFASHFQTPGESVQRMMNVMARLTKNDMAKYMSYKGEELPW